MKHKFEELWEKWQILEDKLADMKTIIKKNIPISPEQSDKFAEAVNKFQDMYSDLVCATKAAIIENNTCRGKSCKDCHNHYFSD